MSGTANVSKSFQLGDGAQFWAYISPMNDTAKNVTTWEVRLEQMDGNWSGSITSDNPTETLQTPGLSGEFKVTVTASGPNLKEKQLSPQQGSNPNIGCNSNCAAARLESEYRVQFKLRFNGRNCRHCGRR